VVYVVTFLVVRVQECLYLAPCGVDGVGMSPIKLISEANAVIGGAVRVTLRFEISLLCPAITDDRRAGFDP